MIVTTTIKSPSLTKDLILDTEKQLQKTIAETAQKISEVYHRTKNAYIMERKVPNEGVQYPLPYMKILKEANQTPRFNWFRDQGSALRGYLEGFGHIETDKLGFMALPSKKPSGALDQALNNVALLGCAEACQLAQWQGVRQVLGDEKFDALFGSTSPFKLIVANRIDNPLIRLRVHISNPKKQEIQLGDMVYVQNVPEYPKYDPFGPATGYNAICINQELGEPKITIQGLNPVGASIDEMGKDLYQELQKEPTLLEKEELPEAIRKDMHRFAKPQPKPKISFRAFVQRGGGALTHRMWIDPKKIAILKVLSPEEGIKKLAIWGPQLQ